MPSSTTGTLGGEAGSAPAPTEVHGRQISKPAAVATPPTAAAIPIHRCRFLLSRSSAVGCPPEVGV